MRKFIFLILMSFALISKAATPQELEHLDTISPYERAVHIIKKYETMHSPRHWPLIGYGHMVMPGEGYRYGVQLTESQADELLRKDLDKLIDLFKEYDEDALLLATLAYNVGPYRLLSGSKSKPHSTLVQKIASGDRDIYHDFMSYNKINGRPHKGLTARRELEYKMLFEKKEIEYLEDEIKNLLEIVQHEGENELTLPVITN